METGECDGVVLGEGVEALGTLAAFCLPRDQRVSLLTPFILAMASKDQAPGVQQRRYG